MRSRLLLLSVCFLAFYVFTDFNWQIGNYLGGHQIYGFLRTSRGRISEATTVTSFLIAAILCYLHFFFFFYQRQQKLLAIVTYVLVGVPIMIGCRYLVQEVLAYAIWGYHNYSVPMRQPARYFIDNIYFCIYYSAFGLVFFFIQLANYQQKRQAELLLQNRQAELSFLRAQINPHFLFNSLNNVYALVYQSSANALPAISKLSGLMRYLLYEKEKRVSLVKEVQYLHDFIDLQLMRYDFEAIMLTELEIPTAGHWKIAPLTLIPFVENAFKHGDLKDRDHPLEVRLSVKGTCINFTVVNKKSNFNKDDSGGIGLGNVKKRMELIYGKDQELIINDNPGDFKIQLTINLKGSIE